MRWLMFSFVFALQLWAPAYSKKDDSGADSKNGSLSSHDAIPDNPITNSPPSNSRLFKRQSGGLSNSSDSANEVGGEGQAGPRNESEKTVATSLDLGKLRNQSSSDGATTTEVNGAIKGKPGNDTTGTTSFKPKTKLLRELDERAKAKKKADGFNDGASSNTSTLGLETSMNLTTLAPGLLLPKIRKLANVNEGSSNENGGENGPPTDSEKNQDTVGNGVGNDAVITQIIAESGAKEEDAKEAQKMQDAAVGDTGKVDESGEVKDLKRHADGSNPDVEPGIPEQNVAKPDGERGESGKTKKEADIVGLSGQAENGSDQTNLDGKPQGNQETPVADKLVANADVNAQHANENPAQAENGGERKLGEREQGFIHEQMDKIDGAAIPTPKLQLPDAPAEEARGQKKPVIATKTISETAGSKQEADGAKAPVEPVVPVDQSEKPSDNDPAGAEEKAVPTVKTGDTKLDSNESPKVKEKTGDTKLDSNESPKVKEKMGDTKLDLNESPKVKEKTGDTKLDSYESPKVKEKTGDTKLDSNESPKVKEKASVSGPTPSIRFGEEDVSSHFMTYFVTISVITIIVYVTYHNRKKIIGLILEGRSAARTRRARAGYSKLRVEPVAEDIDSGRTDPVKDFIY